MLILALDTTAVATSVAVAEIDGGIVKTYSAFTSKNKLTHSEKLMPMIDSVLRIFGKKIEDIELIAVNAGPGSFTGVRIGVATVKGLADGLNIPCVSVSTLDSLYANLEGVKGVICPVMDARREQFYNALYKNGKKIKGDRAVSADELTAELDGLAGDVTVCGDGAYVFASLYKGTKKLKMAPAAAIDQNALSTAVCGYKAYTEGKAVSAADLKPIYLRMSQAERMKNQ